MTGLSIIGVKIKKVGCIVMLEGRTNGYVSFKTRERDVSLFVLLFMEIMSIHMRLCIEHEHHGISNGRNVNDRVRLNTSSSSNCFELLRFLNANRQVFWVNKNRLHMTFLTKPYVHILSLRVILSRLDRCFHLYTTDGLFKYLSFDFVVEKNVINFHDSHRHSVKTTLNLRRNEHILYRNTAFMLSLNSQ